MGLITCPAGAGSLCPCGTDACSPERIADLTSRRGDKMGLQILELSIIL